MPAHTTYPTAATECRLVDRVRRVETPMIAELVAAMFHLECLAQTVGTPEQETAAEPAGTTAAEHRSYVLGNADRIRRALDAITAPYTGEPSPAGQGRPKRCGSEAPIGSLWPDCSLPVHGQDQDHETVSGYHWPAT